MRKLSFVSKLICALKERLGWCPEKPRVENLGRLEDVRKKVFGIIGGVLLASLLTYLMTLSTYLLNNPLLTFFFYPFALMGVASIGAFVGGFLSRDVKAGFLTGLLTGMLVVPIVWQFLIYILPPKNVYVPEWVDPAEAVEVPFSVILTEVYTYLLGILIIFGLVAGVVGSLGAWIREHVNIGGNSHGS